MKIWWACSGDHVGRCDGQLIFRGPTKEEANAIMKQFTMKLAKRHHKLYPMCRAGMISAARSRDQLVDRHDPTVLRFDVEYGTSLDL